MRNFVAICLVCVLGVSAYLFTKNLPPIGSEKSKAENSPLESKDVDDIAKAIISDSDSPEPEAVEQQQDPEPNFAVEAPHFDSPEQMLAVLEDEEAEESVKSEEQEIEDIAAAIAALEDKIGTLPEEQDELAEAEASEQSEIAQADEAERSLARARFTETSKTMPQVEKAKLPKIQVEAANMVNAGSKSDNANAASPKAVAKESLEDESTSLQPQGVVTATLTRDGRAINPGSSTTSPR
jgi:hypothetical protein